MPVLLRIVRTGGFILSLILAGAVGGVVGAVVGPQLIAGLRVPTTFGVEPSAQPTATPTDAPAPTPQPTSAPVCVLGYVGSTAVVRLVGPQAPNHCDARYQSTPAKWFRTGAETTGKVVLCTVNVNDSSGRVAYSVSIMDVGSYVGSTQRASDGRQLCLEAVGSGGASRLGLPNTPAQ